MDKEAYKNIMVAIKDRGDWETRQATWYNARNTGIKRPRLPYPGAPDSHYPLIDSVIEKLKPFYVQQIYAQRLLATFTSQTGAAQEQTQQAEQWFDYSLKQRSNFEQAMLMAVDGHLQSGLSVVKIYWDEKEDQLAFDPIDPLYIVVPQWTEGAQGADWFVHVIPLSRAQYEASKLYKQGKDYVDRIAGPGNIGSRLTGLKEQDVALREGLTYTNDKSRIILWECYTKKNGKWEIETVAPALGCNEEDEPVREPFGLPYKHGQLPFVALRTEIKEKGWYSSRGQAEVLIKHELSLNKSWNAKLQFMDSFGQPMFKNTSLGPINSGNFQPRPNGILPPGLDPVMPTRAPLDFEQEMQFTRALAEDRVSVPDLGASEHLTGKEGKQGDVTATQVNAIIGLSNQSNDLRSRIFRVQLAEIYSQAWSLLNQYAGDKFDYVYENSVNRISPEALKDKYTIAPNGSADSWNVSARQAKALAVYQLLLGKPNVKQDDLLQYLLESGDDPLLFKRLYKEIPDTGKVLLQGSAQWVQQRLQSGQPISPDAAGIILQQGQMIAQKFQAEQDQEGLAMVQQLAPMAGVLQQIAMQPMQAPNGATEMPNMALPNGSNGPGVPALPGPQGGNGQAVSAPAITVQMPPLDLTQMPSPVVNVPAPVVKVNVPAPVVNVPPAIVHVDAPPAPEAQPVNVTMPGVKKVNIIRDNKGEISGATVERD